MSTEEHQLLLGELKGKLDATHDTVGRIDARLASIDDRLRGLESRGAVHGAVAGGFMAVGVSLIAEKVKRTLGM